MVSSYLQGPEAIMAYFKWGRGGERKIHFNILSCYCLYTSIKDRLKETLKKAVEA